MHGGMSRMSNSKKKMEVVVTNVGGKKWARVRLKKSRVFLPSFEDLHRIIQAICYCEDEKYPNGKGRAMVAEFLVDAVNETEFGELAKKYNIPIRCGSKVINPNGAKLGELTWEQDVALSKYGYWVNGG